MALYGSTGISEQQSSISELFAGRFSVEEGLKQLRARLLDLTSRNRLINYRHAKGKSVQFVNVEIDAVYDRLTANKACEVIPVPLPAPGEYRGQLPDPKQYAEEYLRIDTSYELRRPNRAVPSHPTSGARLRVLHYPESLERLLRRIAREAKSAIEETGTNVLHLVFGFLEFFESEQSEVPFLAPLIVMPASLERGLIDARTGHYRYSLTYTGEDITENITLREKLRQDFTLNLPDFSPEEVIPNDYLDEVSHLVNRRPRWRVCRQLSLAMLSFGKLAIWRDLDWQKNTELLKNPLIREIFEGRKELSDSDFAEDYQVDDHQTVDSLIFDADSSQHSAIIDALNGKNLVVNGPPGTGKSQTITNVIACAMAAGKSVLFVSEKLAALEVVTSRLDKAGLVDFCLEFHSHKTQKKRLLESVDARMGKRYPEARHIAGKLASLREKARRLGAYADLLNSKTGNEIGLTVHEILWAADRRRDQVGAAARPVQNLLLPEAPNLAVEQYEQLRSIVRDLGRHFEDIGRYDESHPWFGFFPLTLKPGDDLQIDRALREHLELAATLEEAYEKLGALVPTVSRDVSSKIGAFSDQLSRVEMPSPDVCGDLLARFFTDTDPHGQEAIDAVSSLDERIAAARSLIDEYQKRLLNPDAITEKDLGEAVLHLEALKSRGLEGQSVFVVARLADTVAKLLPMIRAALQVVQEYVQTAELAFDGSSRSVAHVHAVAQVVKTAPLELIGYRRSSLGTAVAAELLERAKKTVIELRAQHEMLSKIFYTENLPDPAEILKAARVLHEGDGLFNWLRKDWRAAKRLYRSLALDKKVKRIAEDCASHLTTLANAVTRTEAFRNEKQYTTVFGALFNHFDTDFERIQRLVAWYSVSCRLLHDLSLDEQGFDPNTIAEAKLVRLSALAEQAIMQHQFLVETKTRLQAEHSCFLPLLLTDGDLNWAHALRRLTEFATELRMARAFFDRISPSTVTAVEIESAIRARLALLRLSAAVDGLSAVHAFLGKEFQGLKTDLTRAKSTLDWGRSLCTLGMPREVFRVLGCNDLMGALRELRAKVRAVVEGWKAVRSLGERLNPYGRFYWTQWQSQYQSADGEDSLAGVKQKAKEALDSLSDLLSWAQYNLARDTAMEHGLKELCQKLESASVPPSKLELAFEYVFFSYIARSLFGVYPELAKFSATSHEQLRDEFVELDHEVIRLNGQHFAHRISTARTVPLGTVGPRAADYTERQLLIREIQKERRHIPIRQLVKRAGRALQALKPCFMMSPLSVAQYIETGTVTFDLVVMDEASQLKPEEALGAVARGRQLIVVGDHKQLPPTSFFDRMLDAGDEEDLEEVPAVVSTESILDICRQLYRPLRTLRWHYRSQHPSLIAFSNHHFYDTELILFPSPYVKGRRLGIRYHYVSGGAYQSRQNIPEAQRVVDAVIDHMRGHPDESLGVVTLNLTQRDLIEEILDKRLRNFPEGERFCERWERQGWPFFVKNLENVQGDERDFIFISTTFGRAPGTERVRQNFGPISRPAGWRRLNVLFTRARRGLHVYSSMQPEDIIVDEAVPDGTKVLRKYLDYAKRGTLIGFDFTEREPESDFEVSVADVLRQKGYEVVPQLGVAGFFIDIAVKNPERPGEFLAAIECDGATYHSAASTRDRDRIRQEILESLGWKGKIHRIWSADWYRSRAREAEKLLHFLEARCDTCRQEPLPPVEEERIVTPTPAPITAGETIQLDLQPVSEVEEFYVEVGDTVTYCPAGNPSDRKIVQLVENQTNLEAGILNENTPLAQCLLGAAQGDDIELNVPGRPSQKLKVLAISRKAADSKPV